MSRNLDTDLDRLGVSKTVKGLRQDVTVRPHHQLQKPRQYLLKDPKTWAWQDLRDYVVYEIEQRYGPFPRDAKILTGIFKNFHERWGTKAVLIARYVFNVCDGRWGGAPVTVNRFTKGSDPYFAAKIADRVIEEVIPNW